MTDVNIRYFDQKETLVSAATTFLADTLSEALDQRGRASLMLSGGSSPEPIYRALAQAPLAWKGIGISLVDERWVPSGHSASNADFIKNCLADSPAAGSHFVPLYNGHTTAEEGLEAATQALASIAQPFDLCVLGMGLDGHTASWFPNSQGLESALDPNNSDILGAVDASGCEGAGTNPERMTLTLSAVMAARTSVLLLTSAEKTDVFLQALEKSEHEAPVKALTRLGHKLTIFAVETQS
ncbi:MAG: 6-phosphogluconolactonase [Pseudomonadota bacterium]